MIVGVVHLESILDKSKRAQAAGSKLQAVAREREAAVTEARGRFAAARERLEKEGPKAELAARFALERDVERAARAVHYAEEERRLEVDAHRRLALEELSVAINPFLKRIAEAKGLELVLAGPSPLVAYAKSSCDVTDELIAAFDANRA